MNKNTPSTEKITFNEACKWEVLEKEGIFPDTRKQALLNKRRSELLKDAKETLENLRKTISQVSERSSKVYQSRVYEKKNFFIDCFNSGDITQVVKLANHDLSRIEKRTADGKVTEDWALMEERELILEFWKDQLEIIKRWTKYYPTKNTDLRKLEHKIKDLIRSYQNTFLEHRPGPKIKTRSKVPTIVIEHLNESLAIFIEEFFPDTLIAKGNSKGQNFYKLKFQSQNFEPMITRFLDQFSNGFLSPSNIKLIITNLRNLPRLKPRTVRTIVEIIIREKYNLSETSYKRLSKSY